MPPPPPWEFAFDPSFPETDWDAWRAAGDLVRAMAAALEAGDQGAIEALSPAFEALGLGPRDGRPSR